MTVSRDDVVAYLTALGPGELQEMILELEDLWALAPVYTGPGQWMMGAPPLMGLVEDESAVVIEVVLLSVGPRRVQVMKAIREAVPLSLGEVVARVDAAPGVISRELTREQAETLRDALAALGAKVEIWGATEGR